MKPVDDGVDYVSAPADYAALFKTYYDYVVALVRKLGIEEDRKEDVASEILLRFYERDFLAKFDPTLVFQYQGEDRPARFKSFLTKFVMRYVQGHLDKQRRQARRELLICDMPIVHPGSVDSPGAVRSWLDAYGSDYGSASLDNDGLLGEAELIEELRAYIAGIPRRSRFDTCDLLALFDEVVRQIRETGAWSVPELRKVFPVSATAMHTWMWRLRAGVAAALGCSLPAKRVRTVKERAHGGD